MIKDYYAELDILPSADTKDIKSAYRNLARKWHPDANLDNIIEAENRFKELAEAYETLGNRERRAKYDIIRPRIRKTPTKSQTTIEKTTQPTKETVRSTTKQTQEPQSPITITMPVVIPANAEKRKSDPELDRAYTIFEATFDRNDEKSAQFSGFFDVFMKIKK